MAPQSGPPNRVSDGPPPSIIQTAPNLVGFDPKLVVPSQTIYLQRNDLLSFQFLTNGTNVIATVSYRWLAPNGEIKEGAFFTPPFGPTFAVTIPLYEGWLLSVVARVTSTPVAGLWAFMQAQLARVAGAAGGNAQTGIIWQGYIPSTVANGLPATTQKEITDGAGMIRSITGATPGAGAEVSEVVPAQRRWTLLSFKAQLVTSAVVANRQAGYTLDDSANIFFLAHTSALQAASATVNHVAAPGAQFFNDGVNVNIIPFPTLTVLKAGFRIRTSTLNLQAGDQWSAVQYEVLEWGNWDI